MAAEGYETTDEVVFALPGDMVLLGVRTIGGFGVAVDNVGRRFVAQTTSLFAFSEMLHEVAALARRWAHGPRCQAASGRPLRS